MTAEMRFDTQRGSEQQMTENEQQHAAPKTVQPKPDEHSTARATVGTVLAILAWAVMTSVIAVVVASLWWFLSGNWSWAAFRAGILVGGVFAGITVAAILD